LVLAPPPRRGSKADRRCPCPPPSSARPDAPRPGRAPTTGTGTCPARPTPLRRAARRAPDHFVLCLATVRGEEAVSDQGDGEMGDVDPDPLSTEPLCHSDGCSTPAEWIEYSIALIAACAEYPFQQCFRFLRWIAETLLRLRVDRRDVCPDSGDRDARRFVKVANLAGIARAEAE